MLLLSRVNRATRRRSFMIACVAGIALLVTAGVFAKNDWFPRTDALSGQKFGWFGNKLPKNATFSWIPFALPSPTPTPQLSKEYIYAGSKLLAVEDATATAAPPTDLAVWRPSNGTWYVLNLDTSGITTQAWGDEGDIAIPGDYDGDGKTDFSVFRKNDPLDGLARWYIITSSNGATTSVSWASENDIPVPADYDGDGKTDRAIMRPDYPTLGQYTWYAYYSSDGSTHTEAWGNAGDVGAPADYDGDGIADIAIWRPSNESFYVMYSSINVQTSISFDPTNELALASAKVVSADYDGDGKANFAVRNGATWLIMNSTLSAKDATTPAGDLSTDKPVPNDYDGDGKCDIAVWRPFNSGPTDVGNWYIRQSGSSGSLRQDQWGAQGDIPVPAYYRR